MNRIGMELLRESKATAIVSDRKDVVGRRDLLSLLTRANMDEELPEGQRLSDEDVLAREYGFPSSRSSDINAYPRGSYFLGSGT
jgi:hypothetical protein